MENEVYIVEVECTNCKAYKGVIGIKKGTLVQDELWKKKCPVCGCKMLSMVKKTVNWTDTDQKPSTMPNSGSTGGYKPVEKTYVYT